MFQLTKDTKTFDFDITGAVQSGGADAGTWSTNQTNQIVLTATMQQYQLVEEQMAAFLASAPDLARELARWQSEA